MKGIKSFYKDANDIVEFKKAFPEVNFRYLVVPTHKYATNALDFSSKATT